MAASEIHTPPTKYEEGVDGVKRRRSQSGASPTSTPLIVGLPAELAENSAGPSLNSAQENASHRALQEAETPQLSSLLVEHGSTKQSGDKDETDAACTGGSNKRGHEGGSPVGAVSDNDTTSWSKRRKRRQAEEAAAREKEKSAKLDRAKRVLKVATCTVAVCLYRT